MAGKRRLEDLPATPGDSSSEAEGASKAPLSEESFLHLPSPEDGRFSELEDEELEESRRRLMQAKLKLGSKLAGRNKDAGLGSGSDSESDYHSGDEKDAEGEDLQHLLDLDDSVLDFGSAKWQRACPHASGSPTGVALCRTKKGDWHVYSSWSDGHVRKFSVEHQRTVWKCRSSSRPTALAGSDDFVALGTRDGTLRVFCANSNAECPLRVVSSILHRSAITALCFGGESTRLYSGSADLTVKVWQLDADPGQAARTPACTYLDTLHGHQDSVMGLSAPGRAAQDRVLSVGARDRTVRLWKIVDEAQLIFRASSERDGDSLQCVLALDGPHFASGGGPDSAHGLALWDNGRKRPVAHTNDAVTAAHLARTGPIVVACQELDTAVRFYRWNRAKKALTPLASVPFADRACVVTGLSARFDRRGRRMLVAVSAGREGRLDRTLAVKGAPIAVRLLCMPLSIKP